jgi:phosphonate transport system substrate-binding protein
MDTSPMPRRRSLLALLAAALASPAFAQQEARRPRRSQDPDVVFPAAGPRGWARQVPQLRIGLLGGENEADRLGRFDGYRKLLEETFKVPARLYPASDYAGVIQAFGAKQIDLSTMSPSAYAGAWLDTNGGVEPIVTTEEADGSISYVSVMLVRADSGITDLAGMRGRSIAWSDPNSASGYLIPRFALRRAGISPESGEYFSRTGFAGGHEQGVIAVLQRQYDAAVTWASGQGSAEQGFTRGNLRAMVEKGMLAMRDLRILWTSDPIPNGPTAARSELPAAFKEDMKLFHLALPKAHPQVYEQIERGGGTGYREADHAMYRMIVDLRREEAAGRRRRS